MMKVRYEDHSGSDLKTVNMARVSFNKRSGKLTEKDIRLIKYLAKHNHWVPFAHSQVTLHMKVPIFAARQIHKHQVGFQVSEVSRRYITDEPEVYIPDAWRKKPEGSVKQGSSEEFVAVGSGEFAPIWNYMDYAKLYYQHLLDNDVAPELARTVLPQGTYTEFYMSGSLVGWARMYNQRSDPHAQKEIQEVVAQVQEIIQPLYPHSWGALTT